MSAACSESDGCDTPGGAAARLAGLRREAEVAYDAITAAERALQILAGQRVAAERTLSAAWYRYRTVANALEAHAQTRPGLRALLATGFTARREWRGRRALLATAVHEYAAPVDAARRARTAIQAEFAATLQARAEAVATLRRLTAECVECAAAIDAPDGSQK